MDNGTYGNYWDTYVGHDEDWDWIGDDVYVLGENVNDSRPLMYLFEVYVYLGGDPDRDGLVNGDERKYGTNPLSPDTDRDGFSDSVEVEYCTDPKNSSSYPTFWTTTAYVTNNITMTYNITMTNTLTKFVVPRDMYAVLIVMLVVIVALCIVVARYYVRYRRTLGLLLMHHKFHAMGGIQKSLC